MPQRARASTGALHLQQASGFFPSLLRALLQPQRLALKKKFSNGLQMGVAGYAYQQLTADSGSGARLGPFKGRVFGIGPHLVYNTVLMHRPVIFNFRNYQEFDAVNRFEGNATTFAMTVKF